MQHMAIFLLFIPVNGENIVMLTIITFPQFSENNNCSPKRILHALEAKEKDKRPTLSKNELNFERLK